MPVTAGILERRLRDHRRSILGWLAGVLGLGLMYLWFFPAIAGNPEIENLLESYPPEILALLGGADLTTPAGYLHGELFSFVGPLVLLIFAIRAAQRGLVGLEGTGVLDLELATPTPRWRLVVEPWASVGLLTAGLVGAQYLLLALAGPRFQVDVHPAPLLAMHLSLWLLTMLFATTTLAVGAATGRPGLAVAVPTVAAVASFVVETFAGLVPWLEPLEPLSPWTWYVGNRPLTNGILPEHILAFVALTALLLGVAVAGFQRRDVGT